MSKFKVEYMMFDIQPWKTNRIVDAVSVTDAMHYAIGYSDGLGAYNDNPYDIVINYDEIRIYNENNVLLLNHIRRSDYEAMEANLETEVPF